MTVGVDQVVELSCGAKRVGCLLCVEDHEQLVQVADSWLLVEDGFIYPEVCIVMLNFHLLLVLTISANGIAMMHNKAK